MNNWGQFASPNNTAANVWGSLTGVGQQAMGGGGGGLGGFLRGAAGTALGAAGSAFGGPFGGIAAGTAGSWLLDRLFPDPRVKEAQRLLSEEFAYQKRARRQAERMARGDFTAAESESIRRANQNQVNSIAEGMGARGLGASPAGASIVAQAQQEPFLRMQAQAQAMLPNMRMDLSGLQALTMTSNRFRQLFRDGYQAYMQLPKHQQQDSTNVMAMEFFRKLVGLQQQQNQFYQGLLSQGAPPATGGETAPAPAPSGMGEYTGYQGSAQTAY